MAIGLGAVLMKEPTKEAQLITKRLKRLGRLSQLQLPCGIDRGKPPPLVDSELWPRQGHTVGGVDRAESLRWPRRDGLAHCFECRQDEGCPRDAFEHFASFYPCCHCRPLFHQTGTI